MTIFCLKRKKIENTCLSSEGGFSEYTEFEQGRICGFVAINVLFVFITNLAFILEPFTHIPYTMVSYGTKGIVGAIFLTILPIFFRKINLNFLLFFILLSLFFLLNYIVYPQLNEFQKNTFLDFILFCLPTFIATQYIENFHIFYKKIIKVSWLIACISTFLLLCYLGNIVNIYEVGVYFMGFGYSMLIPACFCLSDYIMHKHKISLFSFIVLCTTILLMGSRGPLLSIFVVIIFVLLNETKKYFIFEQKFFILDFLKKYIGLFFVLIFLIFYVLFFSNILENISFESRALHLLFSGEFFSHSSGRNYIHDILLREFFLDFISIRGLNAEYLILNGYAHGIVVELLYQFGAIIGGGILILILLRVFKTIISFKEDEHSFAIFIYMTCALCTLLNSHSLWVEDTFWAWIAMTFNLKNKKV